METSFITPINLWGSIEGLRESNSTSESQTSGSMFRGIFENAIQDVRDTESNLQTQQYLLATGQIDDPHTVQIAASEAQLSTSMLVQLRNRAYEAYNELMNIGV